MTSVLKKIGGFNSSNAFVVIKAKRTVCTQLESSLENSDFRGKKAQKQK